jgi:hypothetical protein
LELSDKFSNEATLAWLLEGVVVVAAARGEYERAGRLCAAIFCLRHSTVVAAGGHAWAPYARAIQTSRAALGEERWARATACESAPPHAAEFARALLQ